MSRNSDTNDGNKYITPLCDPDEDLLLPEDQQESSTVPANNGTTGFPARPSEASSSASTNSSFGASTLDLKGKQEVDAPTGMRVRHMATIATTLSICPRNTTSSAVREKIDSDTVSTALSVQSGRAIKADSVICTKIEAIVHNNTNHAIVLGLPKVENQVVVHKTGSMATAVVGCAFVPAGAKDFKVTVYRHDPRQNPETDVPLNATLYTEDDLSKYETPIGKGIVYVHADNPALDKMWDELPQSVRAEINSKRQEMQRFVARGSHHSREADFDPNVPSVNSDDYKQTKRSMHNFAMDSQKLQKDLSEIEVCAQEAFGKKFNQVPAALEKEAAGAPSNLYRDEARALHRAMPRDVHVALNVHFAAEA